MSGIARQTVLPVSVAVSCDNDDPEIGKLLNGVWPRIVAAAERRHGRLARSMRLVHVSRAKQAWAHPAQVRNNGFRALDKLIGLDDDDRMLGLDGDIVMSPTVVERHAGAAGADSVLCFCIYLSQEATDRVTADALLSPDPLDLESLVTAADFEGLEKRRVRLERHRTVRKAAPAWLARLLIKEHKPKLISCHYSVRVGMFRAANGFDEEFTQYGYEDDDLARRLHALRAQVKIGVRDIIVYHLKHPSRAPKHPTESPGWARFRKRGYPAAAVHGIRNPCEQAEPTVRVVSADG